MDTLLKKEKSNWFKRKFWWIFKYKIVRRNLFEAGPCVNCDGRHICNDGVRNCPCKYSYHHLKKRNWLAIKEKLANAFAEIKAKLNHSQKVRISVEVLEDVCRYCESQAIYDKLGNYGDFYYKIKKVLRNEGLY